jgi:sugar phosphate isomerase/epimerase/dienelactone hydrolase
MSYLYLKINFIKKYSLFSIYQIVLKYLFSKKVILSALFYLIFYFAFFNASFAQLNIENQFAKPLKEVLQDVEKKYEITIKMVDSLVKGKVVAFADWKYRTDVEATLDNILKPLDLKVKKEGDKKYKLSYYEYYRLSPNDGWAEMDRIAKQYHNQSTWEKRKTNLKYELVQNMQLQHLPNLPNTKIITTPIHTEITYSFQNMAIEVMPGFWVNGTLFKPNGVKGKLPLILHPQGHWDKHRYRADCQYLSVGLAKMGAMVFNYDMFAYGESMLQFKFEDHRRSRAMSLQVLSSLRIVDKLIMENIVDTTRIGIVGGSGGGTLSILLSAIDSRIKAIAPVANLSSYFYGGCPCESGLSIHNSCGRTNNVEIAAMAAPRPMLVVSDGGDWTDKMPEHDFPYLQSIYNYYGKSNLLQNVHLPNDKHDFGLNKRRPVYNFFEKQFVLKNNLEKNSEGQIIDTLIDIQPEQNFYVFGNKGEYLPSHAIKGFDNLEKHFLTETERTKNNQQYKIGLIDLMLLKRQKLGAIPLTAQLKADGLELDMGGLGDRKVFDNALRNDTVQQQFLKAAVDNKVEIFCMAMSGYYAQSFCQRNQFLESIDDCIATMKRMQVKLAFLPLGVQCDLKKNPNLMDSVVQRLKQVAKKAEAANVVIAIETALSATDEVKLLNKINSKAIKICFNFSNPIKEGRSVETELNILGKNRIAMIHATNKDSVLLENDSELNLVSIKNTLDKMQWSGWLVVERSRDAKRSSDTKYNYGSNVLFLKKIFQKWKY